MNRLGVPHLIFSLVALAFFAAMGIMAIPFPPTAQWFPLYVSIFGGLISVAAIVMCAVVVIRTRRAAAAPAAVLVGAQAGHASDRGTQQVMADADAGDVVLPGEEGEEGEEDEERHMTARGFAWLGVWLAFVLLGLLIGYVSASAIWLGVWFRTVHKWRWRLVIPLVVAITALLLLAEIQLNIKMPGFDWIKSVVRW